MNAYKTLLRSVGLCLMTCLALPACQTAPVPSSSVLGQTVEEAVAIERATICEATKPQPIDPYLFDNLPTVVKKKIASDAEGWVAVCGG